MRGLADRPCQVMRHLRFPRHVHLACRKLQLWGGTVTMAAIKDEILDPHARMQAAGAAQLQPPALHCGRPHPRCAVGGTRSAGQRRQRGGAARATAGGDGGAGDGTAQAAAPQDSSSGVKRPRITVLGGGVVGLSAATVSMLACDCTT